MVSPVLSQGYCASCYGFAAAAAIESAIAIAKKTAVTTVSPQPWVDCFWDFYGCGEFTLLIGDLGWLAHAYKPAALSQLLPFLLLFLLRLLLPPLPPLLLLPPPPPP